MLMATQEVIQKKQNVESEGRHQQDHGQVTLETNVGESMCEQLQGGEEIGGEGGEDDLCPTGSSFILAYFKNFFPPIKYDTPAYIARPVCVCPSTHPLLAFEKYMLRSPPLFHYSTGRRTIK